MLNLKTYGVCVSNDANTRSYAIKAWTKLGFLVCAYHDRVVAYWKHS